MAKSDLRSWAVKGAEQRLVEIAAEARTIFAAFPELRGSRRGFDAAPVRSHDDGGTAPLQKPERKRRKRSAEARRRMSEAQKARWAKQRKAAAKAAKGA